MSEKLILQGIEGGITGKVPEEVDNPTEQDLLVFVRWILRNDSRIKTDKEYPISNESFKEADFDIKDVYQMLHTRFRGGQVNQMRSLIYYAQKTLLPHVAWEPAEILKIVE